MKRSGQADLPLHNGRVPQWLATRMAKIGGAIIEAIVIEYGKEEVLRRISDPLWFQSLGSVMGMDWHSSGITTSVMGALKRSVNPMASELGIYICGGRGKHSRKTPEELLQVGERTGIDGALMSEYSRLSAKVDNTAIQDGFQIYLHNFIVTDKGDWSVIQQGMNSTTGYARRYHWHSEHLQSFIEEPHTMICGVNQGEILNLVAKDAKESQSGILKLAQESPDRMIREIKQIKLPRHHEVTLKDVDIKRLGSVLAVAHETEVSGFEDLLLTNGLGPRTLQSLTLVSEVIYGTPSRFSDPARFSFAHGGKDGHPFPVPLKVYDQSISVLRKAVDKAKIDQSDRLKAIQKLSETAKKIEKDFVPDPNAFDQVIAREKQHSKLWGGRTVFDDRKKPRPAQLSLFG
ncbi:MAG: DUF763 domain-containing protein [Cyclobacteriaceae bacterium]